MLAEGCADPLCDECVGDRRRKRRRPLVIATSDVSEPPVTKTLHIDALDDIVTVSNSAAEAVAAAAAAADTAATATARDMVHGESFEDARCDARAPASAAVVSGSSVRRDRAGEPPAQVGATATGTASPAAELAVGDVAAVDGQCDRAAVTGATAEDASEERTGGRRAQAHSEARNGTWPQRVGST